MCSSPYTKSCLRYYNFLKKKKEKEKKALILNKYIIHSPADGCKGE